MRLLSGREKGDEEIERESSADNGQHMFHLSSEVWRQGYVAWPAFLSAWTDLLHRDPPNIITDLSVFLPDLCVRVLLLGAPQPRAQFGETEIGYLSASNPGGDKLIFAELSLLQASRYITVFS